MIVRNNNTFNGGDDVINHAINHNVPPELIFDAEIGDLFDQSCRQHGN